MVLDSDAMSSSALAARKKSAGRDRTAVRDGGLVPLEAILCTEELWRRPPRAPDHETENRAVARLTQALAETPRNILQILADTVREVLKADSAGMSLLTKDGQNFHWAAIAGDWSPHLGGGTPRDFGPCGDVLDCNRPLLFRHWERRYPYLLEATPLAEEGLLVPFHLGGKAVGTIWAIAHSDRRRFDAEDLRQLESMGRFAAAAYQTVQLLDAEEARRSALDAMEEAARSRRLLEAVVETTPECIKIVAADGALRYMNPAGLQMIGAGSADQVQGMSIFTLIAPEDRANWRDHHSRVCRGERLRWEFDMIGLNGVRRHRETYAVPLPLPDGSTAQLAVTRDVTERQQQERRLRDSERQLRELLEALPAAVYTTDAEGRIDFFNEAAVRLAGRRPAAGDQWCVTWKLYHPDGRPLPHEECPMAIALKEGRPVRGAEAIAERPDGTRVPFIPYPTPLRDSKGTLVGAINMLVDITERKRAEEVMLGQKRILEMVAAGAPLSDTLDALMLFLEAQEPGARCSLLIVAEDGRHFRRGSGPHLPEAFHRAVDGAPLATPYVGSCCEAVQCGAAAVIADMTTETRFAEAWRGLMLDCGSCAVRSTPVHGLDGRVLASLAFHYGHPRDPTPADPQLIGIGTSLAAIAIERTRAEAALRELNETLERKVEERSRALKAEVAERQKIEAALHQSQRLEAIGRLTGGIAHDFNNLLTVVMGQAEAIAAAGGGSPRIASMAAATQRAAERGAQLTNQLLAFARRQQLQPVSVVVHSLISSIGDLVRQAVGETVIVELRAEPGLWPCSLDPVQFESAILNLAINARDAMPKGGRLVIEARNGSVADARARNLDLAPGEYVIVSVADTGAGMTPGVLRRAFEPFFTTKDVGKGTGLGLAQIYGFARQSGGTATVDSAVGAGTTVTMYFPRADTDSVEAVSAGKAGATVRGQDKTVLLVEDQSEVREVIEMSLDSLGFRVVTAADGIAARKVLESDERLDLLLTDVVMPNGVSGLDLAQDARRLRQDLKIILVSGYLRDADALTAAAPDLLFLVKPFSQGQLAETIAAALNGSTRGHYYSIGGEC